MRITRLFTTVLLAAATLTGTASAALADDPSSTPRPGESTTGPTRAGTGFRDATAIQQGRAATATASAGDYLYWVFPADAGRRATVKATVTLPGSATRRGSSTWQLDVYDGLRRRQACMYGMQTRAAGKDAASVELSCTLRTVRSWAEPWDNDPLPGSYYIRLTVTELPQEDLGLPVRAEIRADSVDSGGAHAADGALSAPLVPGTSAAGAGTGAEPKQAAGLAEPEDGWSAGWWSDRWIWTAAGGLLGGLAVIAGHRLTRGPGRPSRVPPGA